MRIAYITCLKYESDVVYHNLSHHYAIGLRDFYVMFNGSDEETRQEVGRFQKDHEGTVFTYFTDNDPAYRQPERFSMMAETAYRDGCEWIVPVDADELVVPELPATLSAYFNDLQYLRDAPYGSMRCRWHDYVPPKEWCGSGNVFQAWTSMYFIPRPQSKIIVKWHPGLRFGDGHHLLVTRVPELLNPGIFYAHYPSRTKAFQKRKMEIIGRAFVATFGENSRRPQVLHYKELMAHGDEYFDTVWEKIERRRKQVDILCRPAWRG